MPVTAQRAQKHIPDISLVKLTINTQYIGQFAVLGYDVENKLCAAHYAEFPTPTSVTPDQNKLLTLGEALHYLPNLTPNVALEIHSVTTALSQLLDPACIDVQDEPLHTLSAPLYQQLILQFETHRFQPASQPSLASLFDKAQSLNPISSAPAQTIKVALSTRYIGQYALVAYDAYQVIRAALTETLPTPEANTPDESKLITLNHVFERLLARLPNTTNNGLAPYALSIHQAANNINGWLGEKRWKRTSETIIHLTEPLLKALDTRFPEHIFHRESRETIETLISEANLYTIGQPQ